MEVLVDTRKLKRRAIFGVLWRVVLTWLAVVAAIAAVMYFTAGSGGAELKCHDKPTHQFPDFLYAAVITTTTVGYGDCTPEGWFRALASIEAFLGVIFAGVLVARVTTEYVDPLAIARVLEGSWFDLCELTRPDGSTDELVSLVEFRRRGGRWECSGRNHDIDGSVRHNFYAYVTGFDGDTFYLSYRNDPAADQDYTSGMWLLKLANVGEKAWYSSYSFDRKHSVRDRSVGLKLHKGRDHQECEAFAHARPGTTEFASALATFLREARRMLSHHAPFQPEPPTSARPPGP